jgi:predicted kinase
VEAREGGGGKLDENRVPVGKDGATTLAEEFLPGGGGAQAEEGALRDAAGGCECVEECEWTELRAALGRMAQRLGDCAAAAVLRLLLPTRPMEVAAGREEAGVEGLASRSRGVDAAPKRLAAFAPRLVIVMRGLPGSGKSCAAAAIATAWNAAAEQTHGGSDAPSPFAAGAAASGAARGPPLCVAGGTRICSADSYFHAGAGILSRKQLRSMTPQQVHRAVFDIKRLGAAHAWCRDAFEDSLREGAPLVIVDNTNSRAAEYDFYRRRAKQEGYAVGVLEMGCAGVSEASGFWKRGTHSVPWEVYGTMMQRWEVDASAVLLSSTAAPPE